MPFIRKTITARAAVLFRLQPLSFLRFGRVIEDRVIDVGQETNRWIRSELDLSEVLQEEQGALYIIQLDFDETQALYFPTGMNRWDIMDRVSLRGQAVKHLLVSDVGITAKEMLGDLHVFLSDLITTEPIAEARIVLKDKNGRILDTAHSNGTGTARLKADEEGRYLEVRAGEMCALMDLQSSRLNTALFAVGGVQKQDGIDAFIYSERGASIGRAMKLICPPLFVTKITLSRTITRSAGVFITLWTASSMRKH